MSWNITYGEYLRSYITLNISRNIQLVHAIACTSCTVQPTMIAILNRINLKVPNILEVDFFRKKSVVYFNYKLKAKKATVSK